MGIAGTADRPPLRLRRDLGQPVEPAEWPKAFSCRTLLPGDAPAVYALFRLCGLCRPDTPDADSWWMTLSGDSEFDEQLCFLVTDEQGRLAGAAQCWSSAFLKDLAVHPDFRRRGIGVNLLRHVFQTFRRRGEPHIDLKVDAGNVTAIRLYESTGMRQVPLIG